MLLKAIALPEGVSMFLAACQSLLLPKATSTPLLHGECYLWVEFSHVFQALRDEKRKRTRRRRRRRIE